MKLIRENKEVAGQLVRFGLTGGLLTVLVAAGYWIVADVFHVEPMLSLTLNFLVFTGLGYVLHSRFSFRGHGSREGNAAARTVRFFTVNTIGFLSNQFFVWLLVKQLDGPTWWPVIPILFVTPLLTFALNRRWVFA
jgi:putative flippase GtrA